MDNKLQNIRLFVSCPDDVKAEKKKLEEVCGRINQTYLKKRSIHLEFVDWRNMPKLITGEETQTIIDKNAKGYDIYFGILWKYFGTEGDNGLTPTEGEFEDAFKSLKNDNKPLIIFFFKNDPVYPIDSESAKQIHGVIQFKERIKALNAGFFGEFSENDFSVQAYDILMYVLDNYHELTSKSRPYLKNIYKLDIEYIGRKICYIEDYKKNEMQYFTGLVSYDLTFILKENKYISIVSEPGSGKTIELMRIAAHYSNNEEDLNPFFVSLNTYIDQRIEDLLPENFLTTPQNQVLIIMDGLDEIPSDKRVNAYRRIEKFISDYPDVRCIISSRANFYTPESKDFSGTLKNFKTYILLPLDFNQVEEFIGLKLKEKTHEFKKLVLGNNLQEFLNIPFYLTHLISLFQKNNDLPNNKAELFNVLIEKRIAIDKEKYRTTHDF